MKEFEEFFWLRWRVSDTQRGSESPEVHHHESGSQCF